jgi:PBP1b-binding outer membrane lipoprotein LpoB
MQISAIVVASLLFSALLLAGCDARGSPKEQSLARCERTFARMAPDPSAGQALCGCIVDGLEAEGLSIIDTMGSDRGKQIASQCAAENGISLPSPG